MRSGNLLFSALHFFLIFLILGAGGLFLWIPHAYYFRVQLINMLIDPSSLHTIIGAGLIAFGMLLFIFLYLMNREYYFQIEMEGVKVEIDQKVIGGFVSSYFQEHFPKKNLMSQVVIKRKSLIEIVISFPDEDDHTFFEKIEKDLGRVLEKRLGYQNPFLLTCVESQGWH